MISAFHTGGDMQRLYFSGCENDETEYEEVSRILSSAGTVFTETVVCPYCDMIHCTLNGRKFDILRYVDGDGTLLYSKDEICMKALEELFGLSER